MQEKYQQIGYDLQGKRLVLGDDDIHCGDVLEVALPDSSGGFELTPVRIEFSDQWYIVGYPAVRPEGLWACWQ